MNKKNRRANNACSRQKFWNGIKLHLDSFSTLLQPVDTLSPEDKNALKDIQFLLYTCKLTASKQENFHKQKLLEVIA